MEIKTNRKYYLLEVYEMDGPEFKTESSGCHQRSGRSARKRSQIYFRPPTSGAFPLQPETSACLSPPWQVKDETPRTPKNTSARCTSSRPSPGTRAASGRPSTRTLPAPRTPATSAGCSATSRTRCCSSPWGTTESSEPPISVEKQERGRHLSPSQNCHEKEGPEGAWIIAILGFFF